ncbi:hypothetical protein [Paragemmobacter ruber]|uniref:Lipoprotein n=1 Tax=Paragemmobacter ruber TaxID=1985673 RepID=A0ABW9Y7P4_9RHOB|nr:hypothetical protein [Rhodobacter ruber]NBE08412.1 hypothetical protein [Rhodobacter ruber]
MMHRIAISAVLQSAVAACADRAAKAVTAAMDADAETTAAGQGQHGMAIRAQAKHANRRSDLFATALLPAA